MRGHRNVAYAYLHFLNKAPERQTQFAKAWVYDDEQGGAPIPTAMAGEQPLTFRDYNWSVSCMVAFFVRVGAHLQIHEARLKDRTAKQEFELPRISP